MTKSKYLILGIITVFGISVLVAAVAFSARAKESYQNMEPEQLHQFVIEARDYGIKQAKERGEYRCCIEPPCAMCYMEANQWNNQTAGTCACDDLIAEGKEPCPQCANAIFCDSQEEERIGCEFKTD